MRLQVGDDLEQVVVARRPRNAEFLEQRGSLLLRRDLFRWRHGDGRVQGRLQRALQGVSEALEADVFFNRPQHADNLITVQWFRDVGVDAALIGLADEVLAVHLRDHDDLAGEIMEAAHGVDAVAIGHEHIDDQEIDVACDELCRRELCGARQRSDDRAELVVFDDILQHIADGFIIIDEHDVHDIVPFC